MPLGYREVVPSYEHNPAALPKRWAVVLDGEISGFVGYSTRQHGYVFTPRPKNKLTDNDKEQIKTFCEVEWERYCGAPV